MNNRVNSNLLYVHRYFDGLSETVKLRIYFSESRFDMYKDFLTNDPEAWLKKQKVLASTLTKRVYSSCILNKLEPYSF